MRKYLPCGWRHESSMVRAAAHGVALKLTAESFGALQQPQGSRVLQCATAALNTDKEASVRAAACRSIGNLAGFLEPMSEEVILVAVLTALKTGLRDSAQSVRIPASWGLGNLCSILSPHGRSQRPEVVIQLISLGHAHFSELVEAAMQAARDSDKVRANGVRAIGNLVVLADSAAGPYALPLEDESWVGPLLQCLLSSLTTGNVKVQWNACVAISNLMSSTGMLARASVLVRLPGMLLVLIMLIRDSANFKIRTHAAAAIMMLQSRDLYADSYPDAVQVIVTVLSDLSGSSAFTARPHPSSTIDGDVVNYQSALRRQCEATLVHLFSVASADDGPLLRDTLVRRRGFLLGFSRAAHSLVAAQSTEGNAPRAELPTTALPLDPFGQDNRSSAAYSEDTPIRRGVGRSSVPGGETGFTAEKVSIETPQLFSAAELKEALKGLADLYSVVETSVQENIIGDELRGLAGSM